MAIMKIPIELGKHHGEIGIAAVVVESKSANEQYRLNSICQRTADSRFRVQVG